MESTSSNLLVSGTQEIQAEIRGLDNPSKGEMVQSLHQSRNNCCIAKFARSPAQGRKPTRSISKARSTRKKKLHLRCSEVLQELQSRGVLDKTPSPASCVTWPAQELMAMLLILEVPSIRR
jgi:hypothetical protein